MCENGPTRKKHFLRRLSQTCRNLLPRSVFVAGNSNQCNECHWSLTFLPSEFSLPLICDAGPRRPGPPGLFYCKMAPRGDRPSVRPTQHEERGQDVIERRFVGRQCGVRSVGRSVGGRNLFAFRAGCAARHPSSLAWQRQTDASSIKPPKLLCCSGVSGMLVC